MNLNGNRSNRNSMYGKSDKTDKEISTMRENEIMSKAVSAIFLLLLKWFRVSRMS